MTTQFPFRRLVDGDADAVMKIARKINQHTVQILGIPCAQWSQEEYNGVCLKLNFSRGKDMNQLSVSDY